MVINNTTYAILPWGLVFHILNYVPDFLFWLHSEGADLFMVVIVVSSIVQWGSGVHH
jgi:hypothetical protein